MRADYLTRFKPSNDGELAEKAISVRLPLEVDAQVRAMQGQQRSEWLRSAIAEKLEREQQQDLSA
jgi:Arc/MetJ-type ribon-helix-helix transcriptional regulator